jgi:DNA-binding response OmpR family regulator
MTVAKLEVTAQRCARQLNSLLELAIGFDQHSPSANRSPVPLHVGRFVVDRTTFSVRDGTQVCELGNTVCFRFVECLAGDPERRFTFDQVLVAVWDGQRRAATTVRSAIFELRSRLREAGMGELANAIHSDGRAYYLRCDGRSRISQQKTNG